MGCVQSRVTFQAITGRVVAIHSDYSCDIVTKYGQMYNYTFWPQLKTYSGAQARLVKMDSSIRRLLVLSLIKNVDKITIISTFCRDSKGDARFTHMRGRWSNIYNEVDEVTRKQFMFLGQYIDTRAMISDDEDIYTPAANGSFVRLIEGS